MARIRTDNVFGTVSDNPLTDSATTLNSAGLADLAAVSGSNHAIIILDPNRVDGDPEIVTVTAHTGAATSATIARAQFGTTAREHAQGTAWVHGPIASDSTSLADATVDQGDFVPMNEWQAWSPVVTQSNTPAQTVNRARFTRHGRLIVVTWDISFTAAGTASNRILLTGLPVAAADADDIYGSFRYFDAGTTNFAGTAVGASTTSCEFLRDGSGTALGNGDVTIANGDRLQGIVTYEAAS